MSDIFDYGIGKEMFDIFYEQRLRELANAGNIDAAFELGCLYHNGNQGGRDYVQAYRWFEEAADLGHVGAQEMLGCMYYDGTGVTQNYKFAVTC